MLELAARTARSMAEIYDEDLGPVLFEAFAEDMAGRVAEARPGEVLEIAAGTGILTRALHDRLGPGRVIHATDISIPMLEVAVGKFSDHSFLTFEQADAMALPHTTGLLGVVVCQFGVMHLPDRARHFDEVARVLRPGGRYFFSVWAPHAVNPLGAAAHRAVARMFPGDPPGAFLWPYACENPRRLVEEMEAAGLSDIVAEEVIRPVAIPAAGAMAEALVYGSAMADEIEVRGGSPAAACAAVERALIEELRGRTELRALVFEARRY